MISLILIQFCTIVFYHFLTYTCHCNIVTGLLTIKEKVMKLCNKKDGAHSIHINIYLMSVHTITMNTVMDLSVMTFCQKKYTFIDIHILGYIVTMHINNKRYSS